MTNVQFLVYSETDDISQAQLFPASRPSSGNASGVIGTNNLSDNGGYTVVAKLSGPSGWAYCSDRAYFTITSDLPQAQPQGSCDGMAGTWSVTTPNTPDESYTLSQSGQALSGADAVAAFEQCGAFSFEVTGTYQGDGVFTLIASKPSGPGASCAVSSITETVTITGPGCNSGSGSWVNSEGTSGSDAWSSTASIPSSETSNFKEWDNHGYSTEARFGATVSGSSGQQFGGRLISEQGSANDGCWDNTAAVKAQTAIDGQSNTKNGTWAIQSDNIYGDDMIGYDPGLVPYYQQHRTQRLLTMPCQMEVQQQMQIQTASGAWQTYQTNPISVTVTSSTVDVKRNGVDSGALDYPFPN